MIRNRKLTLEQRIARLEKLLKSNVRSVNRKNESESAMMANQLKKLLEQEGVYEPVVTPTGNWQVMVELDWDYFGTGEFDITKEDDGYHVRDDNMKDVLFQTLHEVAEFIAEIDEETLADL